jgi:hypothetical protein
LSHKKSSFAILGILNKEVRLCAPVRVGPARLY